MLREYNVSGVPIVDGALFGIKAAVLVIVVEALIRIGRRALKTRLLVALAALAFVGIFFLDLPFPLLSDFWPHGEVSRSYGIFNEEVGVAERGTYVLDGQGIVRWKVEHGIGEARDLRAYRQALEALD